MSHEALYHAALPSNTPVNVSRIELDADPIEHASPLMASNDHLPFVDDTRIRWIFFILGCSVLLSWNVVITAMPFFSSRLANSPFRSTFASYLTTTFTASNFLFLAHATATSKTTIPSLQTRSCLIWLLVLNFLLILSTIFVPSPSVLFVFILFNGATQACVGAYLQTSVIAVASLFGPLAVQAMMSGQAAVAVAVSGVQVISAASSVYDKPRTYVSNGSAEERSAFAFFSFSTLFLLGSMVAHSMMVRMPIYQHIARSLERVPKNVTGEADEVRALVSNGHDVSSISGRDNALRVAKLNIPYEIAVAFVFVVTLAVYPPITTSIRPTNPSTHPLLFSSVHFLVFNIGDFTGRAACSYQAFLIWSAKRLLSLSFARSLFIPLFLMCNIQRGPTIVEYTPLVSSDFLFMAILFFFGWTNGYVSSLCMMSAPSLEYNPRLKGRKEDVDVAATVASFCLVGGLAIGSMASFAVKAIICGCNPFTS